MTLGRWETKAAAQSYTQDPPRVSLRVPHRLLTPSHSEQLEESNHVHAAGCHLRSALDINFPRREHSRCPLTCSQNQPESETLVTDEWREREGQCPPQAGKKKKRAGPPRWEPCGAGQAAPSPSPYHGKRPRTWQLWGCQEACGTQQEGLCLQPPNSRPVRNLAQKERNRPRFSGSSSRRGKHSLCVCSKKPLPSPSQASNAGASSPRSEEP